MPKVVWVFDIDGTLADNKYREHILEYRCDVCLTGGLVRNQVCPSCGSSSSTLVPESWHKFMEYDIAIKDPPVVNALATLNKLRTMKAHIRFVTARDWVLHGEVTKDWLKAECGWVDYEEPLYMQEDIYEGTPHSVYKERCVGEIKKDLGEDVIVVGFDDDPSIVQMYSKYGIGIQCPEGWDSFMVTL